MPENQTSEVQYDRWKRLKYHPDLHPRQRERYSDNENVYICKHYVRGSVKTLALDVGRTEHSVRQHVNHLRKLGKFEHYRLQDEVYCESCFDLLFADDVKVCDSCSQNNT
ncbi:hypothetical protein [Aneurinibacillus migulanus]|uniref:hypothetical protein n=1 Tax=Aneurinibacillus migulanus TaxID=47500 RepID=UPI000B063DFC|nr:hypothetical protein [Aneurinibacillus migulanus]